MKKTEHISKKQMSLSLVQVENLCELVRQYPILFDKSQKGYKERDAVSNAWEEVASSLEFIHDGKCLCLFVYSLVVVVLR